jgi:ribosomal protein S12 methylthiotransferase accessory factor
VDEPIKVTFPGGVRVDAEFKGFTFKTDQPAYAGGTGTQPSPFDLFLASLATCAGYYVVSFCEERKIPSEGLELTLRMERDPNTHLIGLIAIDISLPPGFPAKYKVAVVKAADQCTVKKVILNPPDFEITAAVRT